MRINKTKSSEIVRNGYWYVDETLIEQLKKPGLTSEEREYLACKLRENKQNWREWEEKNESLSKKISEGVGVLKCASVCVLGFVAGALVTVVRRIV